MKEKEVVAHRETLVPHGFARHEAVRRLPGGIRGARKLRVCSSASHGLHLHEEKHHAGVKVYKRVGTLKIMRELLI